MRSQLVFFRVVVTVSVAKGVDLDRSACDDSVPEVYELTQSSRRSSRIPVMHSGHAQASFESRVQSGMVSSHLRH